MAAGNGKLPLAGIRVIDFSQVMMGPCATQMLGDYGADVIKIERPKAGDLSRTSIPDDPGGLDNPVFLSLNRNKRSIALDVRGDQGKKVVYDLVKSADVVVNNFRPGVMERMGFGYGELKKINPRIIYAFGSGFGPRGPNAHKGGQDVLAQAVTGVMHRRADAASPMTVYPTALADYSAGMHLVQGVLLALLQRQHTGEGQEINVSLYNSMIAMQMQEATMWLMRQRELNWGAMPLTGVFATTDGAVVIVGAFKQNPLRDICTALEIDDLSADPRYDSFPKLVKARPELQRIFRERIATKPTAHWIERLEAQDLLCAPVRHMREALDDPQTAVNGMVVRTNGAGNDPLRVIGSPIDMSAAPIRLDRPPRLGEHGRDVLGDIGYGKDAIDALVAAGVVS
ncbi:MAG: CoA transferase [Alphaproteobacteria bacterium]|nr:CoA transferase [Alphaproteobacteria bacterium]